jgi:hypothetical protein
LLEQRQADLVLELLDLHRHRRLCQVHFSGRAGNRRVARDSLEYVQLAQGDVHMTSSKTRAQDSKYKFFLCWQHDV